MQTLKEKIIKKLKENAEKRDKIEKIKTSIGYVKTKTRLGNLKNCAPSMIFIGDAKGKLPKNFLTFCDEFGEPFEYEPLDKEEIFALYREIVREYKKIDEKFLKYKNLIKNAKSEEEIKAIEIEY